MDYQGFPEIPAIIRVDSRLRRGPQSLPILLALLFLAALTPQGKGQGALEETKTLGAAAEAYLSNRDAFRFFKCRFVATRGRARSLDDALAGRINDPVILSGLWLVNGPKVKYELLPDRDYFGEAKKAYLASTPKETTRNGKSTFSFRAAREHYLTDGQIQMRHASNIDIVNLWDSSEARHSFRVSPFNMEVMGPGEGYSPGRVLRDCVEGRFHGRVNGVQKIDGHEVLSISVGRNPDRLPRTYCLDIKRGFLPIVMWEKNADRDTHIYKAFITAVRECSEGRWFPERCVVAYGFDDNTRPPNAQNALEIRVVELDLEHPPPDSEFYLDIAKQTQVSEPDRRGALISTRAPERVYAKDLPRLLERCRASEAEHLALQAQLGGQRGGRLTLLLAIAIPAAALAAVSAVIVLRRRRQRATAS